MPENSIKSEGDERYQVGPFGILQIRKHSGAVDSDKIKKIAGENDSEDFKNALELGTSK